MKIEQTAHLNYVDNLQMNRKDGRTDEARKGIQDSKKGLSEIARREYVKIHCIDACHKGKEINYFIRRRKVRKFKACESE